MQRDERHGPRQVPLRGDAVMLPYGGTLDVVLDQVRDRELAGLVGERRETVVEVPVVAVLWRDRRSLDERYATQVLINAYPVGRLSREDAAAYGPILERLLSDGFLGACEGRIIASLLRPPDPAGGKDLSRTYRVKLWLAPPEQLEAFVERGLHKARTFDPKDVPLPDVPPPPPRPLAWLRRRRGCLLP